MSDPIYEGIEAPTPPKMSRREEVEAARRANANTWKPTQVQDTLWEQTSYGDTVLSGQHASYGDSWRHNDIRNLPAIGPSTTLRSGSIMADTGIERAKERRKSVLVVPSTEESSFVCTSSSGREELSSAHTLELGRPWILLTIPRRYENAWAVTYHHVLYHLARRALQEPASHASGCLSPRCLVQVPGSQESKRSLPRCTAVIRS